MTSRFRSFSFLVLSFALMVPAADAVTPKAPVMAESENLTLAAELVAIAFPPLARQEMMDKIMKAMTAQMTAAMPLDSIKDAGLKQIVLDYMAKLPATLRPATAAFIPKQMDAVEQAYARMFTAPQLRDIVAFARTPSGAEYLRRAPEVLSDPGVAAVNTEYFREASELTKGSAAQLRADMMAYLKAHPTAQQP
ncbi:hypothetical protein [uncultured Novosphingobium sp.]|uniref:hypothetical protein n=1 Tax=uncultured Novosphingobium sp. TaxID=292277 RepID=UPI003748F79F